MDNKPFKPLNNGWGIQPAGQSPLGGGDMHETFQINPQGGITGGHTTVQLPKNEGGQKINIPWNPPKPNNGF